MPTSGEVGWTWKRDGMGRTDLFEITDMLRLELLKRLRLEGVVLREHMVTGRELTRIISRGSNSKVGSV